MVITEQPGERGIAVFKRLRKRVFRRQSIINRDNECFQFFGKSRQVVVSHFWPAQHKASPMDVKDHRKRATVDVVSGR
jgi:hypothetical protein